jgi:imidazolonepropionase-like amidohydrolase
MNATRRNPPSLALPDALAVARLAALASVLATASALVAASPPALVVTNATIWTPQGVQPDREILIHDGLVRASGASGSLHRPTGARVIDATGDTLLPGLIDTHVHLVLGVRAPPDLAAETVTFATARQLLRSGVTSGRIHLWDLPGAVNMKRLSSDDAFPAPRLMIGGPGLFGGRPEWDSPTGNVWGVKSVDDATAKVRRLKEAGVEWVALHALGRFQSGEAEAIAAEARRLGLRLMAGGDSFAEIERALALGVDSLEYQDRSDATAYPDSLLRQLLAARDRVTLVPCLGFPHRFAAYRQGLLRLDDPNYTEFFSSDAAGFITRALAEDRTKEIRWAPNDGTVPPAVAAKFRQLHTAGLPMAAGTDCGSPIHLHADAIWWELETLRRLGLSADEAVRTATETAARLLGRTDIGHLRPGARGDFVIYHGAVSDGALEVSRVRSVAKGGVLHVMDPLSVLRNE